ncbi:MAG: NAD kinase [Betaproteobacteria bacterium]|jgi:NAD+ kinase|nr:NAD kinase [Betaproteobacteria bacterium]NBT66608.1 NAD kinase [Betaproteobacteria bacterium]NBY07489.1 NAD kinase [Betaproteobacteria bacterium]
MKSHFHQIALIGKYHAPISGASAASSRQVLETLIHFLHDQGSDVILEQETATNSGLIGHTVMEVPGIGKHCDLAIVVGGDGTMLSFGRKLAPLGVPLIGINQGRLGFITDIALDRIEATLKPMLMGEYEQDHRTLMHAQVWRDGRCVFEAQALNDVVVNRGATSGMVELRIEVDGHFVANQRADGLIIATPTGSTAYSLSAGGPILQPGLGGLTLVPIAPHILSNRPIVLTDDAQIVVELVSGRDASANFDMQALASLITGDRVKVHKSQFQACFLHPKGWSYFDTLRQKLHWNEGVA